MPESGTGETVTDVLHFPWRDGLVADASRVDRAGYVRPNLCELIQSSRFEA